jgi:hypothetical protein
LKAEAGPIKPNQTVETGWFRAWMTAWEVCQNGTVQTEGRNPVNQAQSNSIKPWISEKCAFAKGRRWGGAGIWREWEKFAGVPLLDLLANGGLTGCGNLR